MTNRTRLDSLRVGERFKFAPKGETYISRGVDKFAPSFTLYTPVDAPEYTRVTLGSRYVTPLDPPPPVLTDEPGKVTKLTGPNSVQTALARKAPRTVYAHQIEPILELATTAAKAIADEDAIEYSTEDELDALTGALNLALKALGLPELNELAEE